MVVGWLCPPSSSSCPRKYENDVRTDEEVETVVQGSFRDAITIDPPEVNRESDLEVSGLLLAGWLPWAVDGGRS